MIDLLQIPGTWQRPNPPVGGQDHAPFDNSAREVVLYVGGEADWQFRAPWEWSSSGHWKIVKGSHLSIFVIYPDPVAIAKGEENYNFYYHLLAIEPHQMILRGSPKGAPDLTWARLAPGRKFGVPA